MLYERMLWTNGVDKRMFALRQVLDRASAEALTACVAMSLCGYVAQLICFPPINAKSGIVNDPSNYLKSQKGKGSDIVLLLRQLPPISIYTTLLPSLFIYSIHLHVNHAITPGKTPLS